MSNMHSDDDVFLVIVADNDNKVNTDIKSEFLTTEQAFDDFAKKLGYQEFLNNVVVKEELSDFEEGLCEIKVEPVSDFEDVQDSHQHLNEILDVNSSIEHKRQKKLKSKRKVKKKSECISVSKLKLENPEFRVNQELLITKLVEIMLSEKPPPPPSDAFKKKGDIFLCKFCDRTKDRLNAAALHYQIYHGPRYLCCYGCGATFRSTGNFYKHEKICSSPDATTILRARALFLGRKGRSRPFLSDSPFLKGIKVKTIDESIVRNRTKRTFHCDRCTSQFSSKHLLKTHENLHKGLRPYKCDQCPASYTAVPQLKKHRLKHFGPQYICDLCGRHLSNKSAIVCHINSHFKRKNYPCTECTKRYSHKAALVLHVNKVHRKLPPPCACEACPKRFYRVYLLKEHMMKEHGLLLVTKAMFYKSLPMMTSEEFESVNFENLN